MKYTISALLLAASIGVNADVILTAPDGTYLGVLSDSTIAPDSTSNPNGWYGSENSPDSINNPNGVYGSEFSPQSPNSPYPAYQPYEIKGYGE